MNWFSVEERLPEFDVLEVWCYDKDKGIVVGTCEDSSGECWSYIDKDEDGLVYVERALYEVTHWMPIERPDPPDCQGTIVDEEKLAEGPVVRAVYLDEDGEIQDCVWRDNDRERKIDENGWLVVLIGTREKHYPPHRVLVVTHYL